MKDINAILDSLRFVKDQTLFLKKQELLENEIEHLFLNIRNSENLESTGVYFRILDHVQTEIAKLLFKEELEISAGLKKFVRDFDRIDDFDLRTQLFKKIKWEKYSL